MILITRLPEPAILAEKKDTWLQSYLKKRAKKPNQRPPSNQYGHREIRETLESMSFHKCFYCERKLIETKGEVDHYIEVTEEPALAFEWKNLYLSCPDCNRRKLSNATIPVSDCLDPCDQSVTHADHLTFDSEYIRPKAGSTKGPKTIQKYKLDRPELNYLRLKHLQRFHELLLKIRDRQIRDGRKTLTNSEKESLVCFKEADYTFSLMFRVYLSGIEV